MQKNTFHRCTCKKDLVYSEMISLLRISFNSKVTKKDWKNYEKNLENLNVPRDTRFSIILWTQTHLDEISKDRFSHRMLHDLERDMLTSEAYGCLVEATYYKVISWNDMDAIIENVIAEVSIPITYKAIKNILADRWFSEANNTDIKIN